ncbi:hypothetical protein VTK26DRAFT_1083 [Humicola hyalothermophila]
MKLNIQDIREYIGYTGPIHQHFKMELEAAQTQTWEWDQETMFSSPDWDRYLTSYRQKVVLFKGFPMVEDVVFVKHPNYWTRVEEHGKLVDSGNCYCQYTLGRLAVALLMYGNASCWLRVKAEHLSFLEKVLKSPSHPRHALYARENQVSAKTEVTGPHPRHKMSGQANLWERLHLPGCWNSEDMGYLTAHVYGVFLVLYKFDGGSEQQNQEWKNKVYDMKTFGSYNNRHIFICYSHGNHFQPLVPNEYYSYEFKLPRLTLETTKKYKLVTCERRRVKDGPGHHFRAAGPAVIAGPLGMWPSFTLGHLARVAGYKPEDLDPPAPEPVAVANSPPPSKFTMHSTC